MEPLEGVYIQQVACGLGHTLYIARDEENDRPLLDKIPVYDPNKVTIVFMKSRFAHLERCSLKLSSLSFEICVVLSHPFSFMVYCYLFGGFLQF